MKYPSKDFFSFPWYDLRVDEQPVRQNQAMTNLDKTVVLLSGQMNTNQEQFLIKILQSVKLVLGQNTDLIIASKDLTLDELTSYKKCISFGPNHIVEQTTSVKASQLNETVTILAPDLQTISQSIEHKKALWHCLKKIYAL